MTVGSSGAWSGTTFTVSVSTTAQVNTTANGCPTRTAAALVRHQHCSGSVSTVVCADADVTETSIEKPTVANAAILKV